MTAIEHAGTRGAGDVPGVDPAVLANAHRLAALGRGTAAQRELARVIERAMELAEHAGRNNGPGRTGRGGDPVRAASPADGTAAAVGVPALFLVPAGSKTEPEVSRFAAAVRGVDAVESLLSAVSASRARLITDAYAHAQDDLTDSERSPGQEIRHADGTIDKAVSRAQITAAALSTVLHISAGAASAMVEESVRFARHMPHTMGLLASGQLTTFHQHLVRMAIKDLSREQCEDFDEVFTERPLTGRYYGPGQDRAVGGLVGKAINEAQVSVGQVSQAVKKRKEGFAGRAWRLGRPGDDGMTPIFGNLPTLHARAIDTTLADLAGTATDGDERTLEQRKADVLMTMFSGPAALSPAAQLELDMRAPSFDENGGYTVVDQRQNLAAKEAWAALRLLAASLNLTFPDVPRAVVTIDVTLETLLGRAGPSLIGEVCPQAACPGTSDATEPLGASEPASGRVSVSLLRRSVDDQEEADDRPVGVGGAWEPGGASEPASGHVSVSLLRRSVDDQANADDRSVGVGVGVGGAWEADGASEPASGHVSTSSVAGRPPRSTTVDIHNPHESQNERRMREATLRGVGEIPAGVVRQLARFGDLQRIITDATTGQPLDVGRRHPSRALRTAIENRDRHCRFPECTRPASTADLDHTTPWRDDEPAEGQTNPWNLAALCREHHRVKHQLHWEPAFLPDGNIQWRNNLLDITAIK